VPDTRPVRDQWAEWIAERRFGGDRVFADKSMAQLYRIRDAVLEHAEIDAGDLVLDVGCGDGLLGFGALDLVGEGGRVIFSDTSRDLLDECRRRAEAVAEGRYRLLAASADDLAALADESVDVVMTRSALIYVSDKRKAIEEFWRVLKPGGRVSLFEPINRFSELMQIESMFFGYSVPAAAASAAKVRAVFERLQPADSDPMLNFDERDVLRLVERAGFFPARLRLDAEVVPSEPRTWDTYIDIAWNPKIPTLREAMKEALSAGERRRLEEELRPLVESGTGRIWSAVAYVWGTKQPRGRSRASVGE
jgi:arsenite methyltransferase